MFNLFSNLKSDQKKRDDKNIFSAKAYADRKTLRQALSKIPSYLYSAPKRKTLEKKFFPEKKIGALVDKKEYESAIRYWEDKAKQTKMLGRAKENKEAQENIRILKQAISIK